MDEKTVYLVAYRILVPFLEVRHEGTDGRSLLGTKVLYILCDAKHWVLQLFAFLIFTPVVQGVPTCDRTIPVCTLPYVRITLLCKTFHTRRHQQPLYKDEPSDISFF